MDTSNLFTTALNLERPWKVFYVEFLPVGDDSQKMALHIHLNYPERSQFPCPVCHKASSLHDYEKRKWRHLDFFQYPTFVHALLPRILCKEHGAQTVDVPWARKGSGFTLLFEGWVVELAKHLPILTIATMVGEHDTRLWRVVRYYTEKARALEDYSQVTKVGIDETSKKGHSYITVMMDLDKHKVLYVTEGKDSSSVDRFVEDFKSHGGDPDRIIVATCDMSSAFQKGIQKNLKNSSTVIDKFHIIKQANEIVNSIRKNESKSNVILKNTKYLWLKNDSKLSKEQFTLRTSLMKKRYKTSRACAMRIKLQDIYNNIDNREDAEKQLSKLCGWMMRSRIDQMKKFCSTLREHWDEILNYFDNNYTNAILEGMNSVIQNVKSRARGFRNNDYFKTMIYLVCGKLDYGYVINSLFLNEISRTASA